MDIRGQTASHPDNAVVLETVSVGGFAGRDAFTVIPLNLPVTSNELLSFVFYGGGSHQNTVLGSDNSSYANGGLWTFGNPPFGLDGPGTWYPNGATAFDLDLIFRTFVDVPERVPEPGTLCLLAFAVASFLVGIGIRREPHPRERHEMGDLQTSSVDPPKAQLCDRRCRSGYENARSANRRV